MEAIELKLNMSIAKTPELINPLDRNKNHPLIKNILTYHLITIKCKYQTIQMIMIIWLMIITIVYQQIIIVHTMKVILI